MEDSARSRHLQENVFRNAPLVQLDKYHVAHENVSPEIYRTDKFPLFVTTSICVVPRVHLTRVQLRIAEMHGLQPAPSAAWSLAI